MKKNDEFELDITDINEDGAGIGKHDGFVFFVPGTLPGDRAIVAATKLKKTYGYARLVEIIEASADRIEPDCNVAGKCGGCSLMHISYEAETRIKEKKVKDAIVRLGGFEEDKIQKAMEPVISMESPLHYRNKAQYPVALGKNSEILMGFYAPYSHRIVQSETCHIGHPGDREILNIIKAWMKEHAISPYNEKSQKGLIRHVLIRHGFSTGEKMVCLVINDRGGKRWKRVPAKEEVLDKLMAIPGMVSVCLNYNDSFGNVIMGDHSECIMGRSFIRDSITISRGDTSRELTFNISPESFYQVNPVQMKRLYEKALEYADLKGNEVVWDLYCGIGTITLALAPYCKNVLGVEVSVPAVRDAKINADDNRISNVRFFEGATEDVLSSESISRDLKKPEVIVMDPPRKGCDPSVLSAILKASPKRIVYVSCNPSTLARDLKILARGGYEIKKITPVDQFPRTMHVETVCLLTRKSAV